MAQSVLRHPLLHVGLAGEDSKKPAWVAIDTVDLGWHIQFLDVDPSPEEELVCQSILQSQLDSTFLEQEKRPGWRMVAWQTKDAKFLQTVFAWNHACFDGMSGKKFHEEVLRQLNTPRAEEIRSLLKNHILSVPATGEKFPPTQEQVEDYSMGVGYVLSEVWKEVRPKALRPRYTTLAMWAPICKAPFRTQVRTFAIDGPALHKILAACRSNRTTLTGLLHATILMSLASQLDQEMAPAFSGVTAVDVRRFTPPGFPWMVPDSTMANFVAIKPHEFHSPEVRAIRERIKGASRTDIINLAALEDLLWATAARVRQEIRQKLDMRTHNDSVGLMKLVGDWRQQMKSQLGKPRPSSWNVSNIGVLDGNAVLAQTPVEQRKWSVEQLIFALGGEVTGAVLQIGAVSVSEKRLCVAVSWQDCAVQAAIGEKLTMDLERGLGHIAA